MKTTIMGLLTIIAMVAVFYLGIFVGYNKGDAQATITCVDVLLGTEKTKSEIKKNASETTRNNASTLSLLSIIGDDNPTPTPSPTPQKEKFNS